MYIEDQTYFALLARLEKLEAAQRDPESDRYLNGLAWAARIDINGLQKNSKSVAGTKIDLATGDARSIHEPLTPGMIMSRLHELRPFQPRAWRRITDGERLSLCLKPFEEATALVEFAITDQVEGKLVYRATTTFWLDPDPALLGFLTAFGDGVPCAFTRAQLLASGRRPAGLARVADSGAEDGGAIAPGPFAGPALEEETPSTDAEGGIDWS